MRGTPAARQWKPSPSPSPTTGLDADLTTSCLLASSGGLDEAVRCHAENAADLDPGEAGGACLLHDVVAAVGRCSDDSQFGSGFVGCHVLSVTRLCNLVAFAARAM